MSFKSSVERTADKAKLNVVIEARKVDEVIAKEFRELSKQLRFPGFRPGKAPRSVVEGQVGMDYVLAQALEELVNETYPLAIDREGLRTIGKVDFKEPPALVEREDYSYTVEVGLRPELTLDSTDVSIMMDSKEATEEEIRAQIEGTQERFATYPALKDKKVLIGPDHFVTFSFKSTIDGEDYEGSSVDKHLYQLGQGMMPEEFDNGLLGAKAGDKLKIEFVVEDTGQNSDFAGKTMSFKLKVDEINERVVPDIDDDFAKQTGFDTVEEMRKEIKAYIESQKEQSWDRVINDKLLEALSEQLEGEPTQELIEARADEMLAEFSRMLEQQNMSLDTYFEASNIDPEQYRIDMETQAAITVSNDLALEALAREKGLVPDDKALDKEFEEAAAADEDSKITAKALREGWEKRGMLTSLRDDLSRRNALLWLRDNATIKTKDGVLLNAIKEAVEEIGAAEARAAEEAAEGKEKKADEKADAEAGKKEDAKDKADTKEEGSDDK